MSDAVSCTVLRTCQITSRSSSEVSIEDEEDAILIEAAIGRGRGVRLVKSTGNSPSDDVEVLMRTEEPAVVPEEGFAAFDGTGSSTSIATSALRFDRRAGGVASDGRSGCDDGRDDRSNRWSLTIAAGNANMVAPNAFRHIAN